MSRLVKMSVRGIRSFNPNQDLAIEFFRPLTIIQGHNGCGKTVSKSEINTNNVLCGFLTYSI